MTTGDAFDLVIIGAGSAGLTGASFGAQLGAKIALVEKSRIGGDCTWTGCVPSKALVKAARVAHEVRRASRFGIDTSAPRIDMMRVRAHVRGAIEAVYQTETPEELARRGVEVVLGAAELADGHTIRVGDRTIATKRIVVCTGARAAIPAISGLGGVDFATYETIFDNDRLPNHLLVVGAGPIGVELGQAYRRLGAEVTIVGPVVLAREEPEVQQTVAGVLEREGVRRIAAKVVAARLDGSDIVLHTSDGEVRGDMLLVSCGRRPNVAGLHLERAGVDFSENGIAVDETLRTSAHHIYAAGDVVGGHQFTHFAAWQCFQAVRNALLPGSARGTSEVLPWVTFLDPEVARVGMTEAEARARYGETIRAHRWSMSRADRAVCEDEVTGFIKIVANESGTIVGASIVAARAGEMIGELALAMNNGLSLADVAATIHAYPTWSTPVQQLATSAAIDAFLASNTGSLALRLARWLR